MRAVHVNFLLTLLLLLLLLLLHGARGRDAQAGDVPESALAEAQRKRVARAFKDPSAPPDKLPWSEACSASDARGTAGVPESLLRSRDDPWLGGANIELDPLERSIPFMHGANIQLHEGVTPQLPRASSVTPLGRGHYHLTHFCLRPYIYGGLYLYGKRVSPRKARLRVCSEFGCHPWPVSYVDKPPPRRAKWISFATAFIKPFTVANPWHELQNLASLSQLIRDANTTIVNDYVHFFPAFQRDNFRRRFFPQVPDPFVEEHFKLWPLLSATFPPGVDLLQINFFESIQTYRSLKNVPLLCYASGYLNSPQVLTRFLRFSPGLLFGELSSVGMETFRERSIELAGAADLNSGWCFGRKKGKRPRPLLGFVFRAESRFICNMGALVRIAKKGLFEVRIIKLEELNIEEQIRVVRQVDVLVGMHGAGLTHVIWMRPKSVLIEMYPPGGPVSSFGINAYNRTNYGSLASAAGVIHLAYAVPLQETDTNITQWRNQNIIMDTPMFKILLTEAYLSLKQNRACETPG